MLPPPPGTPLRPRVVVGVSCSIRCQKFVAVLFFFLCFPLFCLFVAGCPGAQELDESALGSRKGRPRHPLGPLKPARPTILSWADEIGGGWEEIRRRERAGQRR